MKEVPSLDNAKRTKSSMTVREVDNSFVYKIIKCQIPEGWELKALKDICLKIQDGNYGGDYPTSSEFLSEGIPFLTSKAIGGEGEIIEEKVDFISMEKHLKLKKAQLKINDVLFTNRGANVGTIGMADKRIAHGNIGPQLTLLRANPRFVDSLFLKETMKSFIIQSQVRAQNNGSAMNFFGIGDTSKFKVIVPQLAEQHSIVNLLSTWNEAIQINTILIDQKELSKKWLMQNLLTGNIRLKGFNKEWKHVRINTLASEISIKNRGDKELVVLSCTKYNGLVPSLEYFGRKIYSDDLTTYKIVPQNHFAYATNHIEEGSLGYQSNYNEALISPMYTVFRTDNSINDDFLFKMLKSFNYIHEYQKRMEGSIDRRGGLRWDEFSKIKIPLPSLEEQSAITQILQTSDNELQLLRDKLVMLKGQKKGLMQLLLTGKKRLKIN